MISLLKDGPGLASVVAGDVKAQVMAQQITRPGHQIPTFAG